MRADQGPASIAGHVNRRQDRRSGRESQVYRIRIRAHLGGSRSTWFEGLLVTPEADGTTLLKGPVADQPALHGLLARIRDLEVPIAAVTCVETSKEPRAKDPAAADSEGDSSRPLGSRNDSLRNGGKKR